MEGQFCPFHEGTNDGPSKPSGGGFSQNNAQPGQMQQP